MNNRSIFLVFGIFLILFTGCGGQGQGNLPTPTPDPQLAVVDPAFLLGEISPYVYGANHGPWAFVTSKVYQQALDSGLKFIRFPGGNWGDRNTMTEREVENMALLAEQMGAELSISVRLRGGTPEKAADLVRMANETLGLDVRYWSIGNEPALYGDYDTVRYNEEWRAIAEAMLAVDPEILLIGPDVTQFTGNPASDPKDENGLYWIDEFLKQNGDLVDVVSIHRYPFPKSLAPSATTKEELYASVQEWDTIIPSLRSKILEHAGREIPIAVTEVNSHWSNVLGQEASPDTIANAVWWADVLSRMIRQDVQIVTFFSLQSNANIGSYGLFERYNTRPTYFVYQLYKQMGSQKIYANSYDDEVTVFASQCSDEDITVLVINRSLSDKRFALKVFGIEDKKQRKAALLADEVWAEDVPFETYFDGEAIELPTESVLFLSFSEDNAFCQAEFGTGK
ncbi:MAG: hypothetical protein P8Y68_16240 [Anaerolineales bacterium]|jgi:hypothetical protein